jgi:hypothetical protein
MRAKTPPETVIPEITLFTKTMFPNLFESYLEKTELQMEFLEYMKLLLFSHRKNKNDPYLKHPIKCFDLVRDIQMSYTKHADAEFLSVSAFSFLILQFCLSHKGRLFFIQKVEEECK